MSPTRLSPPSVRARSVAQIAGGSVILLCVVCLAGWFFKIDILRSLVPGSTPLKPNIAVGFLLSGAALLLLGIKTPPTQLRVCVTAIAVIITALGAGTLAEHFFNWNLGIENWPTRHFPASMGAIHPARMMPTTAFCFILMGLALFAETGFLRRVRDPLIAGLSTALVFIGILALGGFLLEKMFGSQWNLLGMSISGLTAAVGFMLLGAGSLALLQSRNALTWSLDFSTSAGFTIGILLTVLTTASAFTFAKEMLAMNTQIAHRQELLAKTREVVTAMVELASSERAYTIIGDESLLADREQKKSATNESLAGLRKLAVDNPEQQRRLDSVDALIVQRIDFEEKVIGARRKEGFPTAAQMIATRRGINLSNQILAALKQIAETESGLLEADRKQAVMASTATFLILPLGLFLSLTVLSLGMFFLNAGVLEQKQADKALRESQSQLQTIVENLDEGVVASDLNGRLLQWNRAALRLHGYSSSEQDRRSFTDLVDTFQLSTLDGVLIPVEQWPLARILQGEHLHDLELRVHRIGSGVRGIFNYGGTLVHDAAGQPLMAIVTVKDITERKESEEEIRQLNVDLENRVQRRTAELEVANKELEAFSYSVSHDLRAPLRAVDGFSQAVLEDYGAQLPEEGLHYLQTIREGAQRMGVLIDDLLTFSRLSRLPLNKQPIKSSSLVRDVLAELDPQQNGRKIDIHIGELAPCDGDPALLKQVWINLLSNALKYTRKREEAVVEIGSKPENGEIVYFVRDNGAGFDMRYAGKLFGVFQRLHRADEFEGTGVGLAITQRVIHRHGGRIWAEGEVDRGATFYFSMKKGNNT